MTLNLNKTWEMLLKSSLKVPPAPLAIVERKTKLKLLGVTFETDPVNWDTHIDHVLSKASSRLYILRVCRFYGYPKEQLDLLFQSLIISVFTYAIEVWGCCYYDKYLKRIDKLFARAFKSRYCLKKYSICDILTTRDSSLRSKRFQSSYWAKVIAEAKKRLKGEGEGRRGNACPQTPRFWKTPLDISRFGSFVN